MSKRKRGVQVRGKKEGRETFNPGDWNVPGQTEEKTGLGCREETEELSPLLDAPMESFSAKEGIQSKTHKEPFRWMQTKGLGT